MSRKSKLNNRNDDDSSIATVETAMDESRLSSFENTTVADSSRFSSLDLSMQSHHRRGSDSGYNGFSAQTVNTLSNKLQEMADSFAEIVLDLSQELQENNESSSHHDRVQEVVCAMVEKQKRVARRLEKIAQSLATQVHEKDLEKASLEKQLKELQGRLQEAVAAQQQLTTDTSKARRRLPRNAAFAPSARQSRSGFRTIGISEIQITRTTVDVNQIAEQSDHALDSEHPGEGDHCCRLLL